jgi:hypothetical protein
MTYYRVPMLIDVFRLTSESHDENVGVWTQYLKKSAGGFNYNRALIYQQKVYSGYSNLDSLHRQCLAAGDKRERIENAKVLKLIAPLAVGRTAAVVRMPKRTLTLARGIESPMGPTSLLLENGVVKLCYLHCRNGFRATKNDLAYWAAAQKYEVLDTDYFELPSDFEIINVGPRDMAGDASVEVLSLANLELPSFAQFKRKTDLFVNAFREIDERRLAGERPKTFPVNYSRPFDF